jgi:hypothetical protein
LINSQYILDIFDLAFDDHSESELLRKQIPFLTMIDIDHTGIGAFIHFFSDNQIQQFKLDTSNATNFDIEGNPTSMLDGIEIKNENLSILADAIIWLKNGLIDHLEIFNKCGEDYVLTEPEHYQLDQVWLDNNKRRKIIR